MTLLSVQNLSVCFGNQTDVVKNISFEIKKGETLTLVGESGSGKSVTALSILQLLDYPFASHKTGSIRFKDQELMGANPYALRHLRGNKIAMIFQEPMTSLSPLHSIEKQVSETMLLHSEMDSDEIKERTIELLELVGLKEAKKRLKALPHQLSGGERQRVMIAMALANSPDLLIADEPTTALDVTIQAQILELLKTLQKKLNLAILFISHDLEVVRQIAQKVCVMKDGEIVEAGNTAEVFKKPQHNYTKMLISSLSSGEPIRIKKSAKDLMVCENLSVSFALKKNLFGKTLSEIKAVDNVNLCIKKGQAVALVGESGSGKSTLGYSLLKLQKASGKIFFENEDITDLKKEELRTLRTKMQIVFQDPYASLNPRMTIQQIIEEGLQVHQKDFSKQDRQALVLEVLKDVGLPEDVLTRYPFMFSGGQRQRICLARSLILRPRLIILDEPTSALDVSIQAQIINLLKDLQKKYAISYLFISHDMRVVKTFADYVYVMKNGKIVESGKNPDIFKDSQEVYTKQLMSAAFDFKVK